MPRKNETILDRDLTGRNNFGAIRLLLASLVIFSHGYPAMTGGFSGEMLYEFTGGQMELSAVAVNLFFATSGYLIALSWLRLPVFKSFLLKRVLRIYPGFIAASVISLLVVAPLAGVHMQAAFAPLETAKHVLRILLLSAPTAHGAFSGHPIDVLNLSLWTIRYEFICYLLVPMICMAIRWPGRVCVLGIYVASIALHASQGSYLITEGGFELPLLGSSTVWPKFLCYYLGGMVAALYRDVIPFSRWIALGCVTALVIAARWTGGFFIVFAVAGSYLLFYAAYLRVNPIHLVGRKTDLSYGTYLYGWPVEMLLVHYIGAHLGPWTLFAAAFPVTLALALLSWKLIESPFLLAKVRLDGRIPKQNPTQVHRQHITASLP